MQKPAYLLLLSGLLTSHMAPVNAESVYASDQLTVPMRSGTSTNHKIIKFVPSGEKLRLLESNEAEGFSKVVTITGTEGWIMNADLIKEPGGYERLEITKQQLATEREKIKQLQNTINQLRNETQQQQAQLDVERQKNQKLNKENDLLGNEGLREWFVIGALVSLGSLFVGLIIPRISWRKKDSWANNF